MKPQIIIILIIAITLVKCRNKTAIETDIVKIQETTSIEKKEEILFDEKEALDTTIFLSGINFSKYKGEKLKLELAEEILYQHYVGKGYFRSDKIPEIIKKEDDNKFGVYFDTTHLVNLNNNAFSDAIISFWLTPPGASGHCWQPHKAIISDTDKGYKITNEEFIPSNFQIDTIIDSKENKIVIFGYDYDCGNHKVVRVLKITLEMGEK